MHGGDIVARVLKEEQVKFLFTLCGGHISPILVGAKQAGIRVVDTRHEANAVFAADGVSRLTGITGVAAVTAGPGITNTITALQNALLAQSPLILLGGAAPTLLKGRGALQDIDQMSLMKPNVKWAVAVRRRKDIYPVLKRAFHEANHGLPGPVFVELPVDLLYEESLVRQWYVKATAAHRGWRERITAWFIERHLSRMFAAGPSHEERKSYAEPAHSQVADLNLIREALKSSKQPLLLVGSGAMKHPGLVADLAASVESLGVPVYLSGMARGLLGANHALQFRHRRKEALREADLVILAGVPCDFRLDYGKHIGRHARVVSINISRADLYRNRTPQVAILADPMQVLMVLGKQAPAFPEGTWEAWKENLRKREAARNLAIQQEATSAGQGINPVRLLLNLNEKLFSSTILVADGGDFVATASYTIQARKPLSWLDPGVFGTLGIGAGFAMAAKLCFPEAEVMVLYGDGSSAYSLMEFDTFVRHGLPVTVIIGNDSGWSQIARDQIAILDDDTGTVLASSHYENVARAFGAAGTRVSTMEEFHKALEEARACNKRGIPFLINTVIAKSEFRKGSLSM